jgi:hypothetical protein
MEIIWGKYPVLSAVKYTTVEYPGEVPPAGTKRSPETMETKSAVGE